MTLTVLVWISTVCQVSLVVIFSGFLYLAWKAFHALEES